MEVVLRSPFRIVVPQDSAINGLSSFDVLQHTSLVCTVYDTNPVGLWIAIAFEKSS